MKHGYHFIVDRKNSWSAFYNTVPVAEKKHAYIYAFNTVLDGKSQYN